MIVVIIIRLVGDSMCHQAVSTLDIFALFGDITISFSKAALTCAADGWLISLGHKGLLIDGRPDVTGALLARRQFNGIG